ncbi:MAG: DNA primase [Oscillospiraceae bacterium]|nr:DNA primase [Oscillospiraceae bacterium]
MPFPTGFLTDLIDRNDIEDVVSAYVKLTKRTGANIFGLCPFHNEKTPSFSVVPDKHIFHCFGCGKGGNVINFIMEIENLSYPEAVRFLAKRAGMNMPDDKPDEQSMRRESILKLNKDAAKFFHEQLVSPGGAPARAYVDKRGISAGSIKTFGLGYAPDAWDRLVCAMRNKGRSDEELLDAGLAKRGKKGAGIYDAFRNRLIFPVIDINGSVVGFSGRLLSEGEPKYLNSPETPVFNKSRNLFAMNTAKKSKDDHIILTEGNIDVVTLHQAGFDSAVASLGTSLTPEQAKLISRYTNQVIIAFDSDPAGDAATDRAIRIFKDLDVRVRVLRPAGAKDPDEYIKKNGAGAFRKMLENSETHVEYKLFSALGKYDIKSDGGKVGFLKEASDILAELPGSVEREVYASRAAEMAGVSKAAVESEVKRRRSQKLGKAEKARERETMHPARFTWPGAGKIRYSNARSAAAEEGLIRLLCLEPALFEGLELPKPEDFSAPELRHIYSELTVRKHLGGKDMISAAGEYLSAEETGILTALMQKPEDPLNMQKALTDYAEIIKTEKEKSDGGADLRTIAAKYREKKGYGGQA